MNTIVLVLLLNFIYSSIYTDASSIQCDLVQNDQRFDCYPELGANETLCEMRGCCWEEPSSDRLKQRIGVPYCFFPRDFPEYELVDSQLTADSYVYSIQKSASTFRSNEILKLEVRLEVNTNDRLHVKIVDPNKQRYEVPLVNLNAKQKSQSIKDTDYQIFIGKKPFNLKVYRKSTGRLIFDTGVAPLIYADQYIQFSTMLVNERFYGIGEHRDTLAHDTKWNSYTMWNRFVNI